MQIMLLKRKMQLEKDAQDKINQENKGKACVILENSLTKYAKKVSKASFLHQVKLMQQFNIINNIRGLKVAKFGQIEEIDPALAAIREAARKRSPSIISGKGKLVK